MTTPIHCSLATDRQRDPVDPTPDATPVWELWHRTTAGAAVASGFLGRGTEDAMHTAGRRLMRTEMDVPVTYHLVPAGSYEDFPEPDLEPGNRVSLPAGAPLVD